VANLDETLAAAFAQPAEDRFGRTLIDAFSEIKPEPASTPTKPGSASETVEMGFVSGMQGTTGLGNYFKGLTQELTGDSKAASGSFERGGKYLQQAAEATAGIPTFEEALEEGSAAAIGQQALKFAGEGAPSVVMSLAGWGSGFVAGLGLKGATKTASERLLKDAVEHAAKRNATPEEQDLVRFLYDEARREATKKYARRGGLAGAASTEFPILAGSNLQEELEVNPNLNDEQISRSLMMAVVQTPLGVLPEKLLLDGFGSRLKKAAESRSSNTGSIFGRVASAIGAGVVGGAAIEAGSEAAQEGIAVVNRLDIDEAYTVEQGLMRLGEAAFAGGVVGGVVGGAGNTTGQIFGEARELLQRGFDQKVNARSDSEEFGDTSGANTTPEPQENIDAQIDAMFDSTSTKEGVWVAGDRPYAGATEGVKEVKVRTPKKATADDKAFAVFVPGRGTFISRNADTAQAVAADGATDEGLASVLGYSAPKPEDGDRVVRVTDNAGRIVSEELTNEAGLSAAEDAGEGLKPLGGRVEVVSVEQTLRDRKAALDGEEGIQASFSDPDEASDPNEQAEVTEESEAKEAGLEEVEGELVGRQEYKPRLTPDTVYGDPDDEKGTERLRKTFQDEFGQQYKIDFSDNFWGLMSDSMLRTAIDSRREGLEVEFNTTSDGKMQLELFNFEESFTIKNEKGEKRVNLATFLESEINRASRSEQSQRSRVTIQTPEVVSDDGSTVAGKIKRTNLVDLLNSGRRINQTRNQDSFEGDTAGALSTILGELAIEGYKIRIATRSGPKNLLDFVDLFVKQSALNRKHFKDVITKGQPDAPYPRLPELNDIYDVVVGKDNRGNPLKLGKALLPRNVESAPTTPLQNDDDAVRKPTVDSMGNVIFQDEIGFDGTTEMERMGGDESEVSPVATPGIDGPAKYNPPKNLDRFSRGRRLSNGRDKTPRKPLPKRENARELKPSVTYPLGPINEQVAYLIGRAVKKLPLKRAAKIYGLRQLQGLNYGQFVEAANLENAALAKVAYDMFQDMLASDNGTIAFYFNDSRAGHQIIFDDRFLPKGNSPNALAVALDISHELGHAFFKEEFNALRNNPELLAKLHSAFMQDMKRDPLLAEFYTKYYPTEKIFEEWYADQFSRAARGEFASPKNIKESYFKRLVTALRKMWVELTRLSKMRHGQAIDEAFQQYLNDVLARRKTEMNQALNAEYGQNPAAVVRVNQIKESLAATPGVEGRADVWKRKFRSGLNQYRGMLSIILTADGQLRAISSRLADMFYIPAQSAGKSGMGFLRAYHRKAQSFTSEFKNLVGDLNDPEVQKAVIDAAVEGPLDPSNTKAQAVRDFLAKIHREYIEPSQAGYDPDLKIDFQENYFPTMLNLAAIADNPDRFISILTEAQTAGDPEQIRAAVQRIIKYQQAVINGQEIEVEGFDPAEGRADARALTRGIDRQVLAKAGFLKDPDVALTTYLRQIAKRVEWNKATKDESGKSKLLPMLKRLDGKDRAAAENIISVYLGHQSAEMSPWLRKVNSYGQLLQFVTILPFATIASIPEMAGPILNSKEFGGFQAAFQELRSQFTGNREAAIRFARDIGVTSDESMANAWVSEADVDYMEPVAREWSDKFFKVIGLDMFTRFTREFAAGMGLRFLREHAFNPMERSERYLAQLGVTADEVKSYFDNELDITSPEAVKIKEALQQFVESSILRPNAAERPLWGSDPRFALIWQLKGYFYAFYKTIISGTQREASARAAEGGSLSSVAAVYALAAVPFMALAMAAMETREWAKYGLSELLPFSPEGKDYFRSDNMDWGEYAFEVFDRSGFLGPWTMGAMMHQNAEWNRSPLIPLLGPTAETLDTVFRDGWRSIPNRLIPIHNQL